MEENNFEKELMARLKDIWTNDELHDGYLNVSKITTLTGNVNRDDMGRQKTGHFGGTERAIVTSQCMNYWKRKDHRLLLQKLAKNGFVNYALRSKRLPEELAKLIAPILVAKGIYETEDKSMEPARALAIMAFQSLDIQLEFYDKKIKKLSVVNVSDEDQAKLSEAIAKWNDAKKNTSAAKKEIKDIDAGKGTMSKANAETALACAQAKEKAAKEAKEACENTIADICIENGKMPRQTSVSLFLSTLQLEKLAELMTDDKYLDLLKYAGIAINDEDIKKQIEDLKKNTLKPAAAKIMSEDLSDDLIYQGRMMVELANGTFEGVESNSTTIATHTINMEYDPFITNDDCKETQGASYMDTAYWTSFTSYAYTSINLTELRKNYKTAEDAVLSLVPRLKCIFTTVPKGKSHAYAQFSIPDLIYITITDSENNLMNAFECPVRNEGDGFINPSIKALGEYAAKVYAMTGEVPKQSFLIGDKDLFVGNNANILSPEASPLVVGSMPEILAKVSEYVLHKYSVKNDTATLAEPK